MRGINIYCIFAARSLRMTTFTVNFGADTWVSLYSKLSTLNSKLKLGMYGFDSKMNCHVSMPSLAVTLVNLDCKKLIGENNYALAA